MENEILDDKINIAVNNILTAYLAQMESALKISSILSEHSEEKVLSGDHIIGGLVYRLMVPMSNNEMLESLKIANNIMNQSGSDSDSDSEPVDSDSEPVDSDSESVDSDSEPNNELNNETNTIDDFSKANEPRKIQINNCNCDICSKVKECIQNYHSYQPIDELAFKFKNSIYDTCKKHNIII